MAKHLGVIGEAAFLVFGEDDLVIQGNFKGAASGGEELQARYVLFVFIQHLFRQTDGFREVASRGAVFDAEPLFLGHRCAPFSWCNACRFDLPSMTLRVRGGQWERQILCH